MITRPMLAETIKDINNLVPDKGVYVSPKLDGIRCLKIEGKALTRKFKQVPNNYIREYIEKNVPDGFDGELMIPGKTFNEIQSAVMSEDGCPFFQFHVFDYVKDSLDNQFKDRYFDLKLWFEENGPTYPNLVLVPQIFITTKEQLLLIEKECLDKGYEGVMVRSLDGYYKCGRSTLRQGWLLKLKRFSDSEAVILKLEEQISNQNEQETNELGLSKRSSKKEGMVPAGRLGEFLVRDLYSGIEFKIGTGDGLTQELRQTIWDNKGQYIGKIIKYKYQPSGAKEKPRFPVWLGFRDERDIG